MIEKETEEYYKIQKLLEEKQKSGKCDIDCVVQDENGNLQNFNVINLIVDYANAMEELTGKKVEAFSIAKRLLTLDTFRFENFKEGIDDHLLYNAPVTSQEYFERRKLEGRGAENLGQFNENGDYEYAIAIYKEWGEDYLKKDEGIYAVLVHEFTHYLATHYIQDEKYIKEFMEQNPEIFVSTDDQLLAYDNNGECIPFTRYDVFSGVSRKNGKEFFDVQLGVEKDEKGVPIRDENGKLKVKGILHEQLNSYQRQGENERRITHNRLTEGFTEHIAHLLLEKIYKKPFRELPFEQDKYAPEVSMAELYFKQKDVGDAVYEYITNPQQIIAELENIETKDGNDLFHETTRYLNLNHNVGLIIQYVMRMNPRFKGIINGEPTTQKAIDDICNGTADIIESDFKAQKDQPIDEEKIKEILKKETAIERIKALIDFQKRNDSQQIQYLILKEVGPALQEFYDEKNMIYSLYEDLKTQNNGEKIVMNDEELQYSKSEEEKFIKIHINKSKGFDFDFDIYIPKNLEEQEIERNLLVSFKEEGEREKKMAENLQSPLMTIRVAAEDKSIDVSKYAQLDPSCLVDEDGNKVAYPYGESGLDMSQQYANAIKYAYSCLKKEGLMSQEHHERADIEGYSYNAVIAQRFALLHPEMVRAVICGGAISSIPIPLTEYNGEILNYPLGIADIQKYTGKSPEQILEEYKDIIQIVYATENELRYDGNFTIDGRKIEKGDMSQEFSTTFSSHDVSPDVASVVFQQMKIFGENGDLQTDINKRINSVKELLLTIGVNLRPIKIYGNMDHHSRNPTTLSDMNSLITSLDDIEATYPGDSVGKHSDEIKGFEPETRNGKAIEIDTSFQTKREEIYERLRNGESAKEILQSMSLQEIHKYFLDGATQKSFIKTISPRLIEEVERRKNTETVSYWRDQESEFAREQINSGKESLGFNDPVKAKKAETPIFSEREIGKATIHTMLEKKREAEEVGASDMKEVEREKESSEKGE